MSNSSVFKIRLKVLRSSADLQLYDSEFKTDGALTQQQRTQHTALWHRGTSDVGLQSVDEDCWAPTATYCFRLDTKDRSQLRAVYNECRSHDGVGRIVGLVAR